MHADLPAHGDHHAFARLCRAARLEVADHIGGHLRNARFGTNDALQSRPFGFEALLLRLFFLFGQLIHFIVDLR